METQERKRDLPLDSRSILLDSISPKLNIELSQATLYSIDGSAKGTSVYDLLSGVTTRKVDLRSLTSGVKQPRFSSERVVNVMRAKSILAVKNLVTFPPAGTASDIYSPHTIQFSGQTLHGADKPIRDEFPNFFIGLNQFQPHSYAPVYKTQKPEAGLLAAAENIMGIANVRKETKDNVQNSLNRLYNTQNDFYYGNGTIEGQLGRHQAVMDNFLKVSLMRNSRLYKDLTEQEWMLLMDERFPLSKALDDAGQPIELNDYPSKYPKYMKVELKSDAGPLWATGQATVLREEVVPQDLDIADLMFKILPTNWTNNKQSAEGQIAPLDKIAQEFWQRFGWMRTNRMKPKAAIYPKSELLTKTRNIFVTNSAAFLPASVFLSRAHHRLKTTVDDPDVWSMLGFSIYHGGMDRLVHAILDRKTDFRAVYADNIYLVCEDRQGASHFVSMDGVKFESCITRKDVARESFRSLKQFTKVGKPWLDYATQVLPHLAVGSFSLLGPQQIYLPYMASGVQGTAYFNNTRAIIYLDQIDNPLLEEIDGRLTFSQDTMEPWEMRSASRFTVERVVPLESWVNPPHALAELDMDFLGFNMVELSALGLPGRYVGVLDNVRLYQSISFLKSDLLEKYYTRDNSGSENLVFTAIHFFRLRMFYLLGAWRDPGLSFIILKRCAELRKEGIMSKVSIEEWERQLDEMAHSLQIDTLQGLDASEFVALVAKDVIPTIYEVISLHLGEAEANIMASYVIKNYGQAWSFMPIEVFKSLGGVTTESPQYILFSDPLSFKRGGIRLVPTALFSGLTPNTPSWADFTSPGEIAVALEKRGGKALNMADFSAKNIITKARGKPAQHAVEKNPHEVYHKTHVTLTQDELHLIRNTLGRYLGTMLSGTKLYYVNIDNDKREPKEYVAGNLASMVSLSSAITLAAIMSVNDLTVDSLRVGEKPPPGYRRVQDVVTKQLADVATQLPSYPKLKELSSTAKFRAVKPAVHMDT